jgi:CBS domain-containing protein
MRSLYEELVEEQSADPQLFTETPVFRRRLGEFMASPVITCKEDEPVHSVARTMTDYGISSVIIVDGDNRPIGLLTERDLVRRVLVQGANCRQDLPAREAMNPSLVMVAVNDFFYEALLAVVKNQATHLVVMDADKLVGIISLRHMIKTRSTGTLWLSDKVRKLSSKYDLPSAGQEIDSFLNGLVADKASINEIFEMMANIHDRLTRRIVRLCEEEMVMEGYGPPPVDYCWFEMGSSGRKEQALRTDQDNAIIYDTVPPEYSELAMNYFLRLGNKVVDWLDLSGFARCKGNVMANNTDWCMALDRWEGLVEAWTRRGRPEDIRKLTIFLDFRGIYGKLSLTGRLREHVMRTVGQSKIISHLLTEEEIGYRVPLNLWGGFITEKSGPNRGEINLKNAACIHIVNCLRIFSVKHDIRETHTLARLAELVKLRSIPPEDGEYIEAAYQTLMHLRLRENLTKIKENKAPDNFISPHRLSKREQGMLKDAFHAITRLQKITSSNFVLPFMP